MRIPPYNWSHRQVADDIGAGIPTEQQWRKQIEMEGLIAQKHNLVRIRSHKQSCSILLEKAALSEQELAEYCPGKGM